jgi:hypothetical protein
MMQNSANPYLSNVGDNLEEWGGVGAVMEDPEEQRVLFAALDSF